MNSVQNSTCQRSKIRLLDLMRVVLALSTSLTLLLFIFACASAPKQDSGAFTISSDVVYAHRAEKDLLADVYTPNGKGPFPAVLMLHSGSWARGSKARMKDVAAAFASNGFIVVNANYRLSKQARYPAQLEDARAAVSWMRSSASSLKIDPARIGAMGYSAGGHLALLLATSDQKTTDSGPRSSYRIQAVASAAGPTDLFNLLDVSAVRDLTGGNKEESRLTYISASPIYSVSANDPPALLIHGKFDWIVPSEQSRTMFEAFKAVGVPAEYVELPMGHVRTTIGYNEFEVNKAIDFFKRQLSTTQLTRR